MHSGCHNHSRHSCRSVSAFSQGVAAFLVALTPVAFTFADDPAKPAVIDIRSLPPDVFLTDDGNTFSGDLHGKISVTTEKLKTALNSATNVPADDDPEGNWNWPSEGFQMSVRTDKSSYSLGEAVRATVLVRNAVQNTLSYYYVSGGGGPINIILIRDGRDEVSLKQTTGPHFLVGSSRSVDLQPQTQRKYEIPVNERYDLTQPGEYLLYTILRVPKRDGAGYAEVRSGNVRFNVIAPVVDESLITVGLASAADSGSSPIPVSAKTSSFASFSNRSTPSPFSGHMESGKTADEGKPVPVSRLRFGTKASASNVVVAATAPKAWSFKDTIAGGFLLALLGLVAAIFIRAARRRKQVP